MISDKMKDMRVQWRMEKVVGKELRVRSWGKVSLSWRNMSWLLNDESRPTSMHKEEPFKCPGVGTRSAWSAKSRKPMWLEQRNNIRPCQPESTVPLCSKCSRTQRITSSHKWAWLDWCGIVYVISHGLKQKNSLDIYLDESSSLGYFSFPSLLHWGAPEIVINI